jgi:hypothetical protein
LVQRVRYRSYQNENSDFPPVIEMALTPGLRQI